MALPSSRAKNSGGGLPGKLISGSRGDGNPTPVGTTKGVGPEGKHHTIGPIEGRIFKSSSGHGAGTGKAGKLGLDRRFGNAYAPEDMKRNAQSKDCDDGEHSVGGGK